MNISVPQADLLLALAFAVAVLFWRSGVLAVYGQRLRRRIATLYDELGYYGHTDRTGFSGFEYPDSSVAIGALRQKVATFLLEIFRERPTKRGFRRKLAAISWVLTLLVVVALFGALLLLPLLVGGFVVGYAWQHGVSAAGIVTSAAALMLVYITGSWMHLQAFDRQELGRSLGEVAEAFQDWLSYLHAQNSATAADVTKAPEEQASLQAAHFEDS